MKNSYTLCMWTAVILARIWPKYLNELFVVPTFFKWFILRDSTYFKLEFVSHCITVLQLPNFPPIDLKFLSIVEANAIFKVA